MGSLVERISMRSGVLLATALALTTALSGAAVAQARGRFERRMQQMHRLLGQRFGLVRCTSNGDRTPVPILDDGQPAPLP